jgi:MbtH protein
LVAGELRLSRKILSPPRDTDAKKLHDMNQDEQEDTTVYKVVVNHEEQYSIWPADRENALGWFDARKTGSKAECLEACRSA